MARFPFSIGSITEPDFPAVRLSARFIQPAAVTNILAPGGRCLKTLQATTAGAQCCCHWAIPAWHPAGHPAGFALPRPLLTLPQTSISAPERSQPFLVSYQRSSNFVIATLWKCDMYTVVNAQRRSLFMSNGRRPDGRLVDIPIRRVDAGLVNVRIGISRGYRERHQGKASNQSFHLGVRERGHDIDSWFAR
jgi:hypothetical protein